jgi:peptide/nickel transport system permease protein
LGRALELLLPGLSHLARGERQRGASFLVAWLALILLIGFRHDRVLNAWAGGVWDQVALVSLITLMAGIWWRAQGSERPPEKEDLSPGPWSRVWEGFLGNRAAVAGLVVIVILYGTMLLAPFIAPEGAEYGSAPDGGARRLITPSLTAPLGTDQFSRDLLSGILYGARISLSIGLLAVAISVTLGAFLGAVAAYWGGWLDSAIMRLVDMIMAFPRLVLLIAIVAVFQPSIFTIIFALAMTQWPFTARLMRGEILALKEREFAEAARALGFSKLRILFLHLLPNALGSLIVVATLGIGNTIILEAGLSFLGLGVPAGVPSWGSLVASGRHLLPDAWWVSTFPGFAIVLAVLAFNLVGDGLRDALDPRNHEGGRS